MGEFPSCNFFVRPHIKRLGDGFLNNQYWSFCGGNCLLVVCREEKQKLCEKYCRHLDCHRIDQWNWPSYLDLDATKLHARGNYCPDLTYYSNTIDKTAAKFSLIYNSGFNLTEEDAKTYSRFLIEEAHSRGLSIGQKNSEELIPDMMDEFDWLLTEDAYVEGFYQQLSPYITANKAVFFVEYTHRTNESEFQSTICLEANARNYSAVLKDRDLTDTTIYCN